MLIPWGWERVIMLHHYLLSRVSAFSKSGIKSDVQIQLKFQLGFEKKVKIQSNVSKYFLMSKL